MLPGGQTQMELTLDHSLARHAASKALSTSPSLNDQKVDQIIGILLRVGVIVSALLVFTGAIFYLMHHGLMMPHYRLFRGEPSDLTSIGGIFKDMLRLHAGCLIQLGLLILIATPVARVAFALAAFAIQRDFLYVLVSLIVLGVLLYSILSAS